MTVFNAKNKKHHTKAKMFLDPNGGVNVQRFDVVKYKQFEKLTEKQLGFFWRPEEVDILKDAKDFKELTDFEKHIFISSNIFFKLKLNQKSYVFIVQKRMLFPVRIIDPETQLRFSLGCGNHTFV